MRPEDGEKHDNAAAGSGPARQKEEVNDVSWLQKLVSSRIRTQSNGGKGKVPEGVWEK